MSEKIFDELQKLYDNSKVGALVQEICEYYATRAGYEDSSYEDEIEPTEIVESAYILFFSVPSTAGLTAGSIPRIGIS